MKEKDREIGARECEKGGELKGERAVYSNWKKTGGRSGRRGANILLSPMERITLKCLPLEDAAALEANMKYILMQITVG